MTTVRGEILSRSGAYAVAGGVDRSWVSARCCLLAGVPAIVAVPLPLSLNVTGLGSDPDSLRAGAGVPVVVTVNVPAEPTVKVVLFALVIAGALSTVRVKV